MLLQNSGKLRITLITFGDCGQKWPQDSNFNEWNLAKLFHAITCSRKLKVTLIVIGWARSNMDVCF